MVVKRNMGCFRNVKQQNSRSLVSIVPGCLLVKMHSVSSRHAIPVEQ